MLGFIGRWAQSKGMKIVPSWLGTNKDVVQPLIIANGFAVGSVTQINSTNAADETKHNTVTAQSPVSTTLSDYETPINYEWTSFTFTPFSVFGFSPFGVFGFSPFSVFSFTPAPYFKYYN